MEKHASSVLVSSDGMPCFKIILLGAGRVGKSSLLEQFILGQYTESQITTRSKCEYKKIVDVPEDFVEEEADNCAGGDDINSMQVETRRVQLELWDTAG